MARRQNLRHACLFVVPFPTDIRSMPDAARPEGMCFHATGCESLHNVPRSPAQRAVSGYAACCVQGCRMLQERPHLELSTNSPEPKVSSGLSISLAAPVLPKRLPGRSYQHHPCMKSLPARGKSTRPALRGRDGNRVSLPARPDLWCCTR